MGAILRSLPLQDTTAARYDGEVMVLRCLHTPKRAAGKWGISHLSAAAVIYVPGQPEPAPLLESSRRTISRLRIDLLEL